ncbi:calcium-binding protein [Palleronia caenipelagi]|uniref:Calcium-binding protein n=1 Tax=Palleronia caenipelagi TaxID=2489174 RepID=A0A547PM24_9RHOB|nr:calcium-binding protein [Palleronia caenipelagi]TRD15190.1 calcium-binding protein [Palleronia caenipelagi]
MTRRIKVRLPANEMWSESEILSHQIFGTNMLFHTDRLGENSTYPRKIEALGIKSIRYPGGTITEQYFDPSDPDNDRAQNSMDIKDGQNPIKTTKITPLSEYLAYINSIGGYPTLVFPTYRYYDGSNNGLNATAKAEISSFFEKLFSGEYGEFETLNIEIGNEWHQDRFNWSVDQFGLIQSAIAEIISSAADQTSIRESVKIFAQGGRSEYQNSILSQFFKGDKSRYLDGVVTHIYGANETGNPLEIGGQVNKRIEHMESIWKNTLGKNVLTAITEWNVGEDGEENTSINGIMRSAPLLRMFCEMIESGADLVHLWTLQTNSPAGLSDKEGRAGDISPTGYLFDMLLNETMGLNLIDSDNSFKIHDANGDPVGYNFNFHGTARSSLFFSSGTPSALNLHIDASYFLEDAASVYIKILGAAPGTTGVEYNANASFRFITADELSDIIGRDGTINLYLHGYETAVIGVVYDGGVVLDGDWQNSISDTLYGGASSDTILGNLGGDWISGKAGNDYLGGGEGEDSIIGGVGRDTILGGEGHDTLEGGTGDDDISGGEGRDNIFGGDGRDTLSGGEGDDRIHGGSGNDLILFDTKGNFNELGKDLDIIDGGDGVDTLSFEKVGRGVAISTEERSVEIGLNKVVFDDILDFFGSAYPDHFLISGVLQDFYGNDGNDTFTILSGTQNKLVGGSGNDRFIAFNGSSNGLFGGPGDDEFLFFGGRAHYVYFGVGDGFDTIKGFDPVSDRIVFREDVDEDGVRMETANDGTYLTVEDGDSIFFHDMLLNIDDVTLLFL